MKTKILLLAFIGFFGFLSNIALAQTPEWQWAKSVGATFNNDNAYSVTAVDASGNVYVAGDFASPTATFGSISLKSAGDADMFIAKYDTKGELIWVKNFGGKNFDGASAIAIDAAGNVFVAGKHLSTGFILGSTTLTDPGLFLARFDGDGNAVWAKNLPGTGIDFINSLALDAKGNVFITGTFGSKTLTFGSTVLTNLGGDCPQGCQDVFVAKYDANGNCLWAKSAGGSASDYSQAAATDASGNVFIGGGFYSTTLSFGSVTLKRSDKTAIIGGDMFVAKFDGDGNLLWAKNAGNNNDEKVFSIATDASGDAYVAGSFKSHEFTLGTFTLTKESHMAGYSNFFLAKYDAGGNVLWVQFGGGGNTDESRSVVLDASGNVYLAGIFTSGSITAGTYKLKNERTGTYDIFLIKYDPKGNVLWANSEGTNNMDYAFSLAADRSDNIYLTGLFGTKEIKFGSTTLTNTFGSLNSSFNIYVAKLKGK